MVYHSGCECEESYKLAAGDPKIPKFSKKLWDAAMHHIHNKGSYSAKMLKDPPVKDLLIETNRILSEALDKGITDNNPPEKMISRLQDDVFIFSGCKTHIQLKELSERLVDDNGKVTPLAAFKQQALEIHARYNENYLEAEYIFATSSSEMAAKWADLEKDGDRYNLQYRTAQDDRVRDTHRALANITLPAEDPFWSSYYPPNGWRCRCTAVQVRKEKYPQSNSEDAIGRGERATTEIDSKGNNRAEIFRFNPGKEKVIFPQDHPYYKVRETVEKNVKQ